MRHKYNHIFLNPSSRGTRITSVAIELNRFCDAFCSITAELKMDRKGAFIDRTYITSLLLPICTFLPAYLANTVTNKTEKHSCDSMKVVGWQWAKKASISGGNPDPRYNKTCHISKRSSESVVSGAAGINWPNWWRPRWSQNTKITFICSFYFYRIAVVV